MEKQIEVIQKEIEKNEKEYGDHIVQEKKQKIQNLQ